MGIDFNAFNKFSGLLKNLGDASAKISKGKDENGVAYNDNEIDSKAELNTYVSGWDAIQAKAEDHNKGIDKTSAEFVDVESLESQMKSELAGLMGANFKKQAKVETKKDESGKAVFANDENILEDMMSVLAETTDGIDLAKLREYNKKPLAATPEEVNEMETVMTGADFSPELVSVILDQTPGAIKYISDAIKSGSAKQIATTMTEKGNDYANITDAKELDAFERFRYNNQGRQVSLV